MKEVNKYFQGYKESTNRIDYLKYGLLNDYGYNIDRTTKEQYNEEEITKRVCNIRKNH